MAPALAQSMPRAGDPVAAQQTPSRPTQPPSGQPAPQQPGQPAPQQPGQPAPQTTPSQPAPQPGQPAPRPATQPASPQPAQPGQAPGQSADQAAQTQAAAPGRVFGADAGIVFNQIKPEKTADFERVMDRLREALARSDNPVRQRQAAGWRVFKAREPGPNGSVLYLFWVNPAVRGEDYTVSKILAEAFPDEARELYDQFAGAYAAGQNLVNLELVAELGDPNRPVATSGPPKP